MRARARRPADRAPPPLRGRSAAPACRRRRVCRRADPAASRGARAPLAGAGDRAEGSVATTFSPAPARRPLRRHGPGASAISGVRPLPRSGSSSPAPPVRRSLGCGLDASARRLDAPPRFGSAACRLDAVAGSTLRRGGLRDSPARRDLRRLSTQPAPRSLAATTSSSAAGRPRISGAASSVGIAPPRAPRSAVAARSAAAWRTASSSC